MEERRHAPGAARTRPAPVNSSLSLLHRLQSENETLRSELLRTQQESASLQQQLNSLQASTNQVVRDAVAVNADQMRALEERCRLLADRLVAFKRDGQVSESARVGFLLRSQLEERRFLTRALTAIVETLAGAEAPALADAAVDTQVHTGTLYRLVMAASNGLLEHSAAVKLEKARTRLALEHAAAMLAELQSAMQKATRATFEAAGHAISVEDALACSTDGRDAPAAHTTLSHLRSGFTTPSPFHRQDAESSTRVRDGAETQNISSTHWSAAPHSLQLSEELEWVCDVLKACLQGVRDVGDAIAKANEELKAPVPLTARRGSENSIEGRLKLFPLSAGASPEMNGLLRSFLEDLAAVKSKAAVQQEEMARQLAQEVQRHYDSTQQYDERIKLLEGECTRLLRYAERVADERAKQLPVAPAVPPPTSSQQLTQPPAPTQRDVGVTASVAPANTSATDMEATEHRVTPERYHGKQRAAKTSAPQSPHEHSSSTQLQNSLTESNLQRANAREARSARRANAAARMSTQRAVRLEADEQRSGNAVHGAVPAPLERPSHSLLAEISLNSRPDHSTAKSLFSPRRESSWSAAATSSSAAAAALWSRYRSRNTTVHVDASSAADSPRSGRPTRLMSPAPPPPPPSFPLRSAAATAETATLGRSTSPWRRSVTASVPSGWSALTAGHPVTITTSLSSVSSTSDLLSTPGPALRKPVDGLVTSHVRHRTPALLSSPRSAATDVARDVVNVPAAASAASPLSPPHEVSASSSPSGHSANRTRLSQQLYDEAAADIFSSDSASLVNSLSTPPADRRRHARPRHSPAKGEESPEMRPPSPRWPVHVGYYPPHTASPDPARATLEQRRFSPPSPMPLPSPPHGEICALAGTSPDVAMEPQVATPPLWRRMKDEASLLRRQLASSPIAVNSDIFGTPREVSWINS